MKKKKPADLKKIKTLAPPKKTNPPHALTQEEIYSKCKTYYDQFKEHANAKLTIVSLIIYLFSIDKLNLI